MSTKQDVINRAMEQFKSIKAGNAPAYNPIKALNDEMKRRAEVVRKPTVIDRPVIFTDASKNTVDIELDIDQFYRNSRRKD
ncbi:MAG: hypothetical protein ACRDDY_13250 [Clostridium sp.]|uniref:hypothetical protein n=1 Tax=Clostridium sp. TaxID=1506 RepID=UPI003EE7DF10